MVKAGNGMGNKASTNVSLTAHNILKRAQLLNLEYKVSDWAIAIKTDSTWKLYIQQNPNPNTAIENNREPKEPNLTEHGEYEYILLGKNFIVVKNLPNVGDKRSTYKFFIKGIDKVILSRSKIVGIDTLRPARDDTPYITPGVMEDNARFGIKNITNRYLDNGIGDVRFNINSEIAYIKTVTASYLVNSAGNLMQLEDKWENGWMSMVRLGSMEVIGLVLIDPNPKTFVIERYKMLYISKDFKITTEHGENLKQT